MSDVVVVETPNGDIYASGWYTFTDTTGSTYFKIKLVKFDEYGTLQWDTVYQHTSYNEFYPLLLNAADGNIILASESLSYPSVGAKVMLIWKIDDAGEIQWERTYECTSLESAVKTSNGAFLFTGVYPNPDNEKCVLYKIDADGNLVWKLLYGHTVGTWPDIHYDRPMNLKEIDGYIYAPTVLFNIDYHDGRIFKFDSSGNFLWELELLSSLESPNRDMETLFTLNGNYYFIADSCYLFNSETGDFQSVPDSLNLWASPKSSNFGVWCNVLTEIYRKSASEFYLNQYIDLYEPLYTKALPEVTGTGGDYQRTNDGGHLILTGNGSNYVITKTDCMGNIDFWSDECDSKLPVDEAIILFPNPATDILNVEVEFDIHYILVYGLAGQQVYIENECYCNKQQLDLTSFAAGTYRMRVFGVEEVLTRSFVKI